MGDMGNYGYTLFRTIPCFLLHIVMLRLRSQSLSCGNNISTRALFVADDGVMACCLAYKLTVFVA